MARKRRRSRPLIEQRLVVRPRTRVRLAKGYFFKKVSRTRFAAVNRMSGGITGTFECSCQVTNGGGSCNVTTTNGMLLCLPGTCTNCVLTVTIPGFRGQDFAVLI